MDELGIDEVKANQLGIRVYKVGMTWPLEPEGVKKFAEGLDLILVIEEKRALIETQVKEQLYDLPVRPRVLGKKDENEQWLFPAKYALDPTDIAIKLGERLIRTGAGDDIKTAVAELKRLKGNQPSTAEAATRIPYFCPGCPHNSSTVVPEGSRAYAGIGCHYMAHWMDRSTEGFTQMGGEGTNWIGEAPFSKTPHVFQNLGDGTYIHSGSLAIRAARAAGVNITFKILYNDAVAMTGGQSLDGGMTVSMILQQVQAEGVDKVVVVTDEPDKYPAGFIPKGIPVYQPPRPAGGAEGAARGRGRVGAALRPDLRGREAAPAQARQVPRSRQARVHQSGRVRGLRRLRREVELRGGVAARYRARHQARDRPVGLQQGFLLPERLLPELRHGARRQGAQGLDRAARRHQHGGDAGQPAGAEAALARYALHHAGDGRRRHRRGDASRPCSARPPSSRARRSAPST